MLDDDFFINIYMRSIGFMFYYKMATIPILPKGIFITGGIEQKRSTLYQVTAATLKCNYLLVLAYIIIRNFAIKHCIVNSSTYI